MSDFKYWIWDNALSKEFCELEVSKTNWQETKIGEIFVDNAGITKPIEDKNIRISRVVWVDNISPIGCVAQIYANMANDKAGWNFNVSSCEQIQISKYDSSELGFYDWHTDGDFFANAQYGLVRKLSVTILLSDPKDFEGGVFEFEGFKEQPQLKQGSIIVFPSFLKHRVTPVTSGIRHSAVTWVSGPSYK